MKVCQAFTQLEHQVTLIVPGVKPSGVDLTAHYGLHKTFDIHWLPSRSRRLFPWTAARRAQILGADLVYAWPIQSAAFALLLGMPSMLEMHDLPTGRLGPLWFRLFLSLPGRKKLLPITDALHQALNKKYKSMPERQVIIAPDGVDLESYTSLPDAETARGELGLPAIPSVVCTGHLYAGRGADLFLALAAKFPKVSFVWVGGRPADVDLWKSRAEQLILDNVTFTGYKTNNRIPLYQAAADVLLMPYEKTVTTSSGGNTAEVASPMKMFEYMAAGRAILTSDLPVLREVLDEETAVFCPADDVGAWETALGRLLNDKKLRQNLGQRARNAVQRYAWVERARNILADPGENR